jgi:hypothetical protein
LPIRVERPVGELGHSWLAHDVPDEQLGWRALAAVIIVVHADSAFSPQCGECSACVMVAAGRCRPFRA